MKQLMIDANGIGLAATQVGVLQRLFVFQVAEDEIVALANPEIVDRGEETAVEDEGCLSIQGVAAPGRAADDDRDRRARTSTAPRCATSSRSRTRASPSTRATTSTAS